MAIKTINDYIKDNEINMNQNYTAKQIQDITWTNKQKKEQLARYQPKKKKKKSGFFQGSKYFDDGYDFGDILKTAFWSGADLLEDVSKGFSRTVEGTIDTLGYLSSDVLDFFGADDTADWLRDVSKYDVTGKVFKGSDYLESRSVFGDYSDTVFEGVGNVGGMAVMNTIMPGSGVTPTIFSSFSSAYGNSMGEALRNGADLSTARKTALINGTAEAISEQFFDALPGMKVEGWGSKAVGKIGSAVERYFGTNTGKLAMKILNASGEGFEEIISNMLVATGNDIMHGIDKNFTYGMEGQSGNIFKDLKQAATSKESWNAFISATLTSALTNGGNQFISNTQKNKLIKSYAQENNMTVSQVKQMFNQSVQQKTQAEMQRKPNMDLGQRVDVENQAKAQTMGELKRGTFVQPGTETDAYKYQETDNEKVNNMNKSLERIGANNDIKTREAAALGGRLARDLGLDIEFTNKQEIEQKIKNGELNPAEGTDINGYVANGKMYLNLDSDQMVNFAVGHETKHFFEANEELNESLNDALEKYAKLKGRYKEDLEKVTKTYTDKDGNLVGDPKAELMANYVGEFFTDYDFVSNLSTKNPTLFTKVRDFFQKLYYKATNQKEKLFIKQINDNINKAYREYAKTQPGKDISSAETKLLTQDQQETKQKEENILPITEKVEEKVEEKPKTNKKEFQAIIYSPKSNSPVIANVEGTTSNIEGIDVGIYKDGKNNWHVIDLDSKLSLNTGQESKKTRKAAIESAIKNIQENDIESLRKTQAERYKDIKEDKTLSNKDIQYSLSPKGEMIDNETGEKVTLDVSNTGNTGTLMAIHNLSEDKLNGVLDLGGFPVPSIAITSTDKTGQLRYGNITVLFDKNTINPQVKENEVYSSDIYSSRFPALENKINDNVINDLVKKSNYELSYQELKMLAEENKFNADRVPEDLMKVFFNDKGIEWNEQNRDYYENNDDGYNEYSKWVNDLSNQIIGEKRVVKPDVDYYTPSGNIRSIEQRTLPYTLENVVKIMTKKSTKGSEGNGWTGTGEIRGNLSPALKSIEEIKQNENKLITTEEMEQYKNKIEDDFSKITDKLGQYYKYKDTNSYYVLDTVADSINETAKAKKVNAETLKSKLADNFIEGVPDEILNETIDFLNSLKNAPTEYFEAKPQRAVGLDEIQQVVIPSNSSQELRDRLQEMGIPFVEYNPEVEGDRQRVINQFDDLKFSLSQQGEDLEQQYQDLFPIKNKVTTRLSDLKKKEVELPTEEENTLKTAENEQKQGEKPTRREVIDRNRQLAREQLGEITNIKDKKRGFLYQINTMKRNLRDIMSKEQAQKMYDTYFKDITTNNAKIENEITSYNERIQKYNLNDAESTYTQMIGELKHNPETTLTQEDIDNFYNKNINKIDQQKCENAVTEFRNIYDELIEKINDVLTDNGYKPIEYRKGYFPHFIEEKATSKLGKLAEKLGWKVKKGQLPTDVAGITDQFKPGKAWTSFSQQRTGDATDYNALKGLDNYLRGAMDVIYHTNDIQKLRALENEIRYQYSDKGIQEKINDIYADDTLDMEEKNDAIANLTANIRESGLGNFVTEIRNYTDNLANKKSITDRGLEQTFGRDVYSIMNNINGRVSANMVGANISSAITNFIPITQAWGNISTKNLMKGMYESIKTSIKGDDFADRSTFLTNRTKQADRLYNTKLEKINKKLGIPFEAIDSFTANTIVRGKYYDNIAKGMSEQEAINNADEFAKDVMAGRSKGDQPTMFNKKNPLVKLFTAFQLEVNNQYGYMFKDIPTNLADEAKDKLIGAFIKMFLGAWLYNEISEKFTGRRAAFDPIDMAVTDIKTLTDENMDLGDKIQSIVKDTSQELPFVSGVMGGGRLPIQGAIPYSDPLEMITSTFEDIGKLDDPEKRKTAINNLKKEWSKPVYYLLMPFAGGQIKKTVEGLSMYDKDLPVAGSYTNSGKLRFEADTSPLGKVQAAVFGQYASKNAREYFEKGYTPLTEKQLNTALDADMSANEYREYTKGLKEQKTTEEKVDYIYDLPLSDSQKNVLVNSALTRKDDIDLSNYGDYGSLAEFDYANKNPEKYLTISNITDYDTFQTYKEDISAIKNSYNNTDDRKQAVFEYINSLPLNIEQKLMLQKMAGGYSIKQYRGRMHDYINSLDLTIEEKQSIDDVLFK